MNDSPLAHPEWLALVAAMRFAPDDDTPRLVGADWLEETGKPELSAWGEFIRIQCEAAAHRNAIGDSSHPTNNSSHPTNNWCDCGSCRPERKATMLADRWLTEWKFHSWELAPVEAPIKEWQRGFAARIAVSFRSPNLSDVVVFSPSLFERQPTRSVTIQMDLTHSFRGDDRYVFGIFVDPTWLLGGLRGLQIDTRLSRRAMPQIKVDRRRFAKTPEQFAKAVPAALRDAIRGRSALTV